MTPRGMSSAAVALAAAAGLAAAIGLPACSRREPARPAPAYPYRSDAAKVFYATSSGLTEATGEGGPELPASKAPNASVLSADGSSIAVAVNGWGVARIESSADASTYRIVDSPDASSFAGLATGGMWPKDGGFLVHLYRDPFADSAEASGTAASAPEAAASAPAAATDAKAARLLFFGAGDAAATTPLPLLAAGFEPFVLLPSKGTWFAQLRKDAADRVDTKFFAIDDPLASTPKFREIPRAEFEAALKPLPLSSLVGDLGIELRSALGALGTGPWLVRLRSGLGDDRWYLGSGKPEEAINAYAWSVDGRAAPDGRSDAATGGTGAAAGGPVAAPTVVVLTPDGRLAVARGGGAPALGAIPAPEEGASFTALAAVGPFAAAAWENGVFPDISSAGIVLQPLAAIQ